MHHSGHRRAAFARVSPRLIALACALGVAAATAQESVTVEEAAPTQEAPPVAEEPAETEADAPDQNIGAEAPDPIRQKWYSGTFETRLDAELSDRDSNLLLDQILRAEITPPNRPRLRIKGGLWLLEDLDGHESSTSSIADLHNTFESSVQLRVLHLYLEVDDLWGESTLRLGRQRILESPAFNRIDGLYFAQRRLGWGWYIFGGARASLYEDAHNDRTLGGGVNIELTRKTRLALDAFYGEDDRGDDEVFRGPLASVFGLGFPRRVKREIDSRLFSVTLQHQLTPRHHLYARYTLFDGDSDELLASATGVIGAREITYHFTVQRREQTLGDRVNDLTGFFRVLGEQNEFTELLATTQIPINDHLSVSLEGQFRETESDDPETANRDFQRYAAGLHGHDLWRGIDAHITAELWDVSDGEGSVAITGGVSKEWEQLKLTAGVDFERWEDRIIEFRPFVLPATRLAGRFIVPVRRFSDVIAGLFDTEVVDTHENIYSIFTELDYVLNERQEISLELSYEQDDGPDSPYWELDAAYRLRF